jgi:predicted transposase YdaD
MPVRFRDRRVSSWRLLFSAERCCWWYDDSKSNRLYGEGRKEGKKEGRKEGRREASKGRRAR